MCIFTTVRSRLKGGIGFVADARRINVGLSRARSSLLVIGNAAALRKDRQWAGVVSYSDSIRCHAAISEAGMRLPIHTSCCICT